MYSVYSDGKCIYNDRYIDEGHRLINPKLKLEDNKSGSFTAVIPPVNVGFDTVKRLSSVITVKQDGVEIWSGRVLTEETDFFNNRKITCEGELGYLNDTVQPPAYYHDVTVDSFLKSIIDIHNAKVDDYKKFTVGIVTVSAYIHEYDDDGTDITEYYTDYDSTLSCISEKLIKKFKGHLRIRKVNGIRYLDYLKDPEERNPQVIRFGKNLIDFTKNWDLSELATVVIPKGKSLEESPIENLTAYLTVESVNNKSIYVVSEEAVKEYGWIETVVDWSNTEDPKILLNKAKAYLADYQFDNVELELTALDMHALTKSEQPIKLLQHIRCVSKPHGMDKVFPVTRVEIPLDNPENAVYILGGEEERTLTANNRDANNDILDKLHKLPTKQLILRQAKEKAAEMINNATHGNVVFNYDKDKDGIPDTNSAFEILIMDTKDINTATKVWRWNMGGLGYSNKGYNPDSYEVAITMDGSIVANFITTGTMYADRIMGGTLTMGGSNNTNGVIKVKDGNGKVCVTIDCNGINVNNGKFKVDMNGNVSANVINAFGLTGNAVSEFSKEVDDSEAMRLAKQAIATAQSAANQAASAAAQAQSAANVANTTVNNLVNTVIPDINNAIQDVSNRVSALESKK